MACSWQFDDGEQSCGRTSALCATAPQSRQGYVDLLACFVLPSVVGEHHTERMNATSQPSSFRLEECWVAHFKYTRQYLGDQTISGSSFLTAIPARGVPRCYRPNDALEHPTGAPRCLSGDCDALADPMINCTFFQTNILQFRFS